MEKHLKEKQYYIDRYDKMTVIDCRWHENFNQNYPNTLTDKSEEEKQMIASVGHAAWEIEKIFITLGWYDRKESTIQKWMHDDERRDRKLESARVPENIFCDECYSRMQYESKHLWDHDNIERVLFFFGCPKECKKRKAIYDNGEIYLSKPHLCEKCRSETEISRENVNGDTIQTTYTCHTCMHVEVDVFELISTQEVEDPKYEYDRTRFCLAGEDLHKAQEAKRNMESMKELVDSLKEKQDKKDLYDAAAQIKKLTIPQIKEQIVTILEKEQYSNVTFEKPDLGRIVSLNFSVEELETTNEHRSTLKLKKIMDRTLTDTNWRLMSEGVSYRLGVLYGRIRVYESDEDLVKLLEMIH